MPIIESKYRAPWYFFKHPDLQTIIPSVLRKVNDVNCERKRLELKDGDFLDYDFLSQNSDTLLILTHGLEGSSDRHYVRGMMRKFAENHIDSLAWNLRGCSGENNRLPRLYHHGDSQDLKAIIQLILEKYAYKTIFLVGFSMGASLTLKYLGEEGSDLPKSIKRAYVASVPYDLKDCSTFMEQPKSKFYVQRFMKKLDKKVHQKSIQFPDKVKHTPDLIPKMTKFREFDNLYTAPLHGFRDADDYYDSVSVVNFAPNIQIPTLIVNALDDPFLPESCYPISLAKSSKNIFLEMPKHGGHTGFMLPYQNRTYSEEQAFQFLMNQ